MSPIELFIIRHAWARYAFVLISFPILAVSDRVRGTGNPTDFGDLRRALAWARRGGIPGERPPRPEPAPISDRWRNR